MSSKTDLLIERRRLVKRVNALVQQHNAQVRTLRRLVWAVPVAFALGLAVGYVWAASL